VHSPCVSTPHFLTWRRPWSSGWMSWAHRERDIKSSPVC